jgi:transposase
VVLEATGGCELSVAEYLVLRDIPVAVVNPRQVRDFAKALGIRAKADPVHAGFIARFVSAIRSVTRSLKDIQTRELDTPITRRKQLVEMITTEKNRLAQAAHW